MRQDDKMTDRYSPRPQSNYQSLEDLRNVRFTDGVSTHSNSSSSMSRSCGETPENAWSFRALEAKESKEDDIARSPIVWRNSASNQTRRIPSKTSARSSSADLGASFGDSGMVVDLRGLTDRSPLLPGRSASYDSISQTMENGKGFGEAPPTHRGRFVQLTSLMETLNLWPIGKKRAFSLTKICVLFVATIVCCVLMLLEAENENRIYFSIINAGQTVNLYEGYCDKRTSLLRSAFRGSFYSETKADANSSQVYIFLEDENVLNITIDPDALQAKEIITRKEDIECQQGQTFNISASSDVRIPLEWRISPLPPEVKQEVIYAFLILAFVYILIIFEIIHRTLAAMIGALAALAVLSYLNQRPTMGEIISWIDLETITLLFGMMIIVAIFAETGFFDYSALQAYKLAKGKVWPLITILCVFSAFVSAFLDNVTTILLMTPVTIRLCEVLNLDPKRILIAEVLFSNIGGTATAIGDPPNVIIVGALTSKGIGFSTFTSHMFPGIVIISFVGYGVLRFYYRDMSNLCNKDPPAISEMKHEVAMWRRAAGRMPVFTREETLMRALFLQKAVEMEHNLNKIIHKNRKNEQQSLNSKISQLEKEYYIKDIPLLVKCGAVLLVVIILLFTYSFIDSFYTDIGWIAVLGAIWLLVLADVLDFEGILHKVEWATLLFFAALFILMEALGELGLITSIGDAVANLISTANEDSRLVVALLLILWVSALASSFIDNIPYTTAMIPILQQLSNKPELDLPLLPLVIALAMGACLGGNGTLIGASCNVVCAGIAEQHGYGFTFKEFFKIGFPMMLVTTLAATCYVLVCHVGFHWNST